MGTPSPQEECHHLQGENRHLKETITALREELERMRVGEQERFQQGLAAAREEIGQLREMTVVLREELERQKIRDEEKRRTGEQAAREEVRQLQEMIRALRDRLEGKGEGAHPSGKR